jgi:hypothetical protein
MFRSLFSERIGHDYDGWDKHATFMDGLVDDGFVILGGPIGDGQEVTLVVEAGDEREIETRLGQDPWAPIGIIRIGAIRPWAVWLDGRHGTGTTAHADPARGTVSVLLTQRAMTSPLDGFGDFWTAVADAA